MVIIVRKEKIMSESETDMPEEIHVSPLTNKCDHGLWQMHGGKKHPTQLPFEQYRLKSREDKTIRELAAALEILKQYADFKMKDGVASDEIYRVANLTLRTYAPRIAEAQEDKG